MFRLSGRLDLACLDRYRRTNHMYDDVRELELSCRYHSVAEHGDRSELTCLFFENATVMCPEQR